MLRWWLSDEQVGMHIVTDVGATGGDGHAEEIPGLGHCGAVT